MNCIIIAPSYQSIMLKNKQLEHLNKIYITLHRKIMNSCYRFNEQWRILSLICFKQKKKKKSNKQLQNIFRTSHKISLYNIPHLGKFIKSWWSSSQKIFLFHTLFFINLSVKPLAVFSTLPHLQVHSLHVQVSVLYLFYTCSPVSGLSPSNSYTPVHQQ